MNPVLLVIAGPNGSGKTTLTTVLRRQTWSHGLEYLNPDDVARDRFGDWNSPQAVLDAARWTTERREALLAQRAGLAFETVFSTDDKLDFIARARAAGYFVRLFFIATSDPCINAARVALRVLQGGHTVPIDKIVGRYVKSLANLTPALRLVDRGYLYDNSIDDIAARLCARTADGQLRRVYAPLPAWVSEAVESVPRHVDFVEGAAS